jgi:hypothetical protein
VDILDDEGRLEFPCEDQMYSVLGLKKEDETEEQERERRCDGVRMVHVPFRYFSTYRGRG